MWLYANAFGIAWRRVGLGEFLTDGTRSLVRRECRRAGRSPVDVTNVVVALSEVALELGGLRVGVGERPSECKCLLVRNEGSRGVAAVILGAGNPVETSRNRRAVIRASGYVSSRGSRSPRACSNDDVLSVAGRLLPPTAIRLSLVLDST